MVYDRKRMEMNSKYFVDNDSIVRKIWGKSDTILFIFAGAAAEFALNKAVDWLYFTGRLPSDPLGRLFSTVAYARTIVFSKEQAAIRAISSMASIHANVESKRGYKIPDWAYRDVLFMLIDYSIRSYEILERKMTWGEKKDVFTVFNRVGLLMGLKDLPRTFEDFERMRAEHLERDMQRSDYTKDLFLQYKKHLGAVRYTILLEAQKMVVPGKVKELLHFRNSLFRPIIILYKFARSLRLDWVMKEILLPSKYKDQIKGLDDFATNA